MVMEQRPTAPRGRPRNTEIDSAIVSATLELLAERGYAELTIGAVATRAGVGRPTVYARFPDKNALVVHSLVQTVPQLRNPDTGNALRDLTELATEFATQLVRSPIGRTVLAVHAEAGRHPELADLLRTHYWHPREQLVHELIHRGQQQGSIRADITPEHIQDLVYGPLLYHWLILGEPDRHTMETLLTASLHAITPCSHAD